MSTQLTKMCKTNTISYHIKINLIINDMYLC